MPASQVAQWKEALQRRDEPELWAKVERYLDASHGACYLRDERAARVVENALLHFDGERYRLLAWTVMPNHVHALIETVDGHRLDAIFHSWKSYTANQINRLFARRGALWQPECFDRFIRSEQHLMFAINYIENNPVQAGLVTRAEEWPFGSAFYRAQGACMERGLPARKQAATPPGGQDGRAP
ncbi:MAG: transposase [Armatimonadota bacterium]|nr:transposase [Armatimonadota bacterium]